MNLTVGGENKTNQSVKIELKSKNETKLSRKKTPVIPTEVYWLQLETLHYVGAFFLSAMLL